MIKALVKKQGNFAASTPKIKNSLKELLQKEGIVSDTEVSVSLVGEAEMLKLAKKFLGEDDVLHNVLSFPFTENSTDFVDPPDNVIHLGEIVVCYPKAKSEANEEGMLIDDKVIELVNHGALHLMGKHHE